MPAFLLDSAYGGLLFGPWPSSAGLPAWPLARCPVGMRNAGALALRYAAQTNGYLLVLTDAYPYSGPDRCPALPRPPRWRAAAEPSL